MILIATVLVLLNPNLGYAVMGYGSYGGDPCLPPAERGSDTTGMADCLPEITPNDFATLEEFLQEQSRRNLKTALPKNLVLKTHQKGSSFSFPSLFNGIPVAIKGIIDKSGRITSLTYRGGQGVLRIVKEGEYFILQYKSEEGTWHPYIIIPQQGEPITEGEYHLDFLVAHLNENSLTRPEFEKSRYQIKLPSRNNIPTINRRERFDGTLISLYEEAICKKGSLDPLIRLGYKIFYRSETKKVSLLSGRIEEELTALLESDPPIRLYLTEEMAKQVKEDIIADIKKKTNNFDSGALETMSEAAGSGSIIVPQALIKSILKIDVDSTLSDEELEERSTRIIQDSKYYRCIRAKVKKRDIDMADCQSAFKVEAPWLIGKEAIKIQFKAFDDPKYEASIVKSYDKCLQEHAGGRAITDQKITAIKMCVYQSMLINAENVALDIVNDNIKKFGGGAKLSPKEEKQLRLGVHACLAEQSLIKSVGGVVIPTNNEIGSLTPIQLQKKLTPCLNGFQLKSTPVAAKKILRFQLKKLGLNEKEMSGLIGITINEGLTKCFDHQQTVINKTPKGKTPPLIHTPQCILSLQSKAIEKSSVAYVKKELASLGQASDFKNKTIPGVKCFSDLEKDMRGDTEVYLNSAKSEKASLENKYKEKELQCARRTIAWGAGTIATATIKDKLGSATDDLPSDALDTFSKDIKNCFLDKSGKMAESKALLSQSDSIAKGCAVQIAKTGSFKEQVFRPLLKSKLEGLELTNLEKHLLVKKLESSLASSIEGANDLPTFLDKMNGFQKEAVGTIVTDLIHSKMKKILPDESPESINKIMAKISADLKEKGAIKKLNDYISEGKSIDVTSPEAKEIVKIAARYATPAYVGSEVGKLAANPHLTQGEKKLANKLRITMVELWNPKNKQELLQRKYTPDKNNTTVVDTFKIINDYSTGRLDAALNKLSGNIRNEIKNRGQLNYEDKKELMLESDLVKLAIEANIYHEARKEIQAGLKSSGYSDEFVNGILYEMQKRGTFKELFSSEEGKAALQAAKEDYVAPMLEGHISSEIPPDVRDLVAQAIYDDTSNRGVINILMEKTVQPELDAARPTGFQKSLYSLIGIKDNSFEWSKIRKSNHGIAAQEYYKQHFVINPPKSDSEMEMRKKKLTKILTLAVLKTSWPSRYFSRG